jgi:hypothetical protein
VPFMLLVVEKPEEKRALAPEEGKRRYDRMMQFADGLKARGVLVAGESLGSDANGTRITKRAGRQNIVDGPFAEAKEILGGFFLLDIESRDEALKIAEDCPAAEWSTIELRQVGRCWG